MTKNITPSSVGAEVFLMAKAQLKMQGFELFDDGEVWNNSTGIKVGELTGFKVNPGSVDVHIRVEKALEYINVNMVIEEYEKYE